MLYLANILGAVLGSLAVGFVLIRGIGMDSPETWDNYELHEPPKPLDEGALDGWLPTP